MLMLTLVIVPILLVVMIAYTQKGQSHQKTSQLNPYKGDKNKRISDLNSTYDRCKKEFLNLEVKKYNNQIVIREHAGFNATPKDLVYVTFRFN